MSTRLVVPTPISKVNRRSQEARSLVTSTTYVPGVSVAKVILNPSAAISSALYSTGVTMNSIDDTVKSNKPSAVTPSASSSKITSDAYWGWFGP